MPYYPETKFSKPKSAGLGGFIEKISQQPYKGFYVETFDKKYYSGKTPMDTGIELQKVINILVEDAARIGTNILLTSITGFFAKKLTKGEIQNGVAKRYFIQDRNNKKITEIEKQAYLQAQKQLVNTNFLEVDWIIKGPAEDKMFGNYSFEGAESKNKKAIQALELQMKGISTFITDYKYLVEEPVLAQQQQLTSQSFTEQDADTQLQNDRKANFDLRK